ncbi:MAG: G-D-S-L family lipolytic protein, partial [Planctomycetales bacterium]|nr:G-D-S-L family lipolytic protein [Planctomycetales bacterium]
MLRAPIRIVLFSLVLFCLETGTHSFRACFAQEAATAPAAQIQHAVLPATDDDLPGVGPIRRYDWFQNLWSQRRGDWAQRQAADQGAVVFLGDSITQGWGDDFGQMFPGLKLANRGISGDTTRGMLIRLQDDVLSLKPTAVVLLMGTNDLEEQAEPAQIASNLKLIIAELKQHNPQLPIVLCQVFPSSGSKKRPADKIRQINQLYVAAVKGDPQITVVDTWTLFADAKGDAKPEEFPDLLHPNAVGYLKWGAALRPIFATLDLIETEDDQFTPESGYQLLFNGRDLTGWGFRPTSKEDQESARRWQASDPNAAAWPIVTEPVSFDGQGKSNDGRYAVHHGRLVVTAP